MFDRHLRPIPQRPTTGLRYRFETLVGITGIKMMKYRPPWRVCVMEVFELVFRPAFILPLLYVMCED